MKKSLFLLLILTFMVIQKDIFSQFYRGSEISYRNLGGNDYEVSLILYINCGQPDITNATLSFVCLSHSAFNFNANLSLVSVSEISTPCASVQTKCSNSSSVHDGFREYILSGNVTMPPCQFYRISYSVCCRSPVNTILNPTSHNVYVETYVNTAIVPGGSSPEFASLPVAFLCTGETSYINMGAIDPDGDSLSYLLTYPQYSHSHPLPYLSGYTYLQPLPSVPPVSCDPLTGTVKITPQTDISTPLAIQVRKWRKINGTPTVIGEITRDIVLHSFQCNNSLPVLSGVDLSPFPFPGSYKPADTIYNINVCAKQAVGFYIHGFDADTFNPSSQGNPEKFSISWNNGIAGANFITYNNGSDSAYAYFSWVPDNNDISKTPHCFTATIMDEACPYKGFNMFTYCLTVEGISVSIDDDTLICRGDTITVTAMAGAGAVNYTWLVNNVQHGPPTTSNTFDFISANYPAGIHTVSVKVDLGQSPVTCYGTAHIRINNVHRPDINLGNDTVVCQGNSITLDAGPGQLFMWNTGATTQTISISQVSAGMYSVTVDGGNNTRCKSADSIYVEVVTMPNFELGNDTCLSESLTIGPKGLCTQTSWFYLWNDSSTADTLHVVQSAYYILRITADTNTHCFRHKGRVVNIIDMDKWVADNSQLVINPAHEYKVYGPEPPTGHNYSYKWYLNGDTAGEKPYFTAHKMPEGKYTLKLNAGGCEASIELLIPKLEIKLYPNPASNTLYIDVPIGEEYIFDLFDIHGKRIMHKQRLKGSASINTQFIASGMYLYSIRSLNGEITSSGKIEIIK